MNPFFGHKSPGVFHLVMLITLARVLTTGIALAIDAHPPQLVGRWVTELAPSMTIVFQEQGSLKQLRGDEPVADNGYWEQSAEGRLRIKWFTHEPILVSYKIEGDVLRITTDKGDTVVHRRVRAEEPIEIEGGWIHEDAPSNTIKPCLLFHADGTYQINAGMWQSGLGPRSTFPDPGRGVWKWLENDWIEFTSPSIEGESRWHVKYKDDEMKFVSPRGEIIVFKKAEVSPAESKEPPTATEKPVLPQRSDDDLAEVTVIRKVRAQVLEREVTERLRVAKSQLATDPLLAKDILKECQVLVSISDDLDRATKERLLGELESLVREAIVQSHRNKAR